MRFDFGSFMLGMFAAVVAFMIGHAAAGQEFPSYLPPQSTWDVLELRESSEGHLAELLYQNSAAQASTGVTRPLEWNGISVHVEIILNGHGMAEVLTVTPLDPAHLVFPEGPIPVLDGEEVVVQIMAAMF